MPTASSLRTSRSIPSSASDPPFLLARPRANERVSPRTRRTGAGRDVALLGDDVSMRQLIADGHAWCIKRKRRSSKLSGAVEPSQKTMSGGLHDDWWRDDYPSLSAK